MGTFDGKIGDGKSHATVPLRFGKWEITEQKWRGNIFSCREDATGWTLHQGKKTEFKIKGKYYINREKKKN